MSQITLFLNTQSGTGGHRGNSEAGYADVVATGIYGENPSLTMLVNMVLPAGLYELPHELRNLTR